MYRTGMRLMQVMRLRVQDVDFAFRQVVVRVGKGNKDRVLPLPSRLESPLVSQIAMTLQIHATDLELGFGRVHLPHALARK
ncbi:MAG: tyrosine-type recombinase/integrase [Pseudomonadota bacterium]|nr:tyrosine-type recombinase/integrase [Pseudomonadota bacterium]